MSKMSLFPRVPNMLTPKQLGMVIQYIGISHADLADRLDIDRKTVTRWLDGKSPIPGAVALLLNLAHEIHGLTHTCRDIDIGAQAIRNAERHRTRDT